MADIWLRSSDGNDVNAGTLKELPKATLASALTAAGAGGKVYVSSLHAGTVAASITLASPGTLANPTVVLCVADWGANTGSAAPTTLATTATVTTTGLTVINLSGAAYSYGVTYTGRTSGNGSGVVINTSQSDWTIESGGIGHASGTGNATAIDIGATRSDTNPGVRLTLINSGVSFAAVGSGITVRNQFIWKNSTALLSGSSVPTTLINTADRYADIDISACNLSSIDGNLVNVGSAGADRIRFSRCQLHASATIATGTITSKLRLEVDRCQSGTTLSVPPVGLTSYQMFTGTASHSLTRYRTGGAADGVQANAYSLEAVSNANAKELYSPLEINLGSRWVGPKSSISGATAQNLFTSYRAAPLATPAALTTDAVSTWTGTGVGTKQKIDHTLSNGDTLTVYVASGVTLENDEFWIEVSEPDQVAGLVTVKAFLAKPSTTVYVDPKIEVA